MAQVINTNMASLNAQRNLNKSQSSLATSLQRLSSGMRINSAKDDAAGLAISERFTAQIKGLNQAVRNSNDGISLAQTAEGALGEVTNNLQRIRELAVQSANATNSASDRAAMQQEVSQLVAEIDRVATQTNFNGVKLLDGSFSAQTFQVGANVGETITVDSIANSTKSGLGLNNSTASETVTTNVGATDLVAGDLTINGVDVGAVIADAKEIATAIAATAVNVTATATNTQTIAFADVAGTALAATDSVSTGFADITVAGASATASSAGTLTAFTNGNSTNTYDLTIDTISVISFTDTTGQGDLDDTVVQAAFDAFVLANTGYTISSGDVASDNIVISKTDGTDMVIDEANNLGATVMDATFIGADFTGGTPAGASVNYTLAVDGTNIINTTITAGNTFSEGDAQLAIAAFVSGNSAYTSTGSVASGGTDLVISKVDGTDMTITESGASAVGGTFVAAHTGGDPEVDANFFLDLDGVNISLASAQSSSADVTITGAEMASIIDDLAGFTATFASGNLSVAKADGSNFTLTESGTDAGSAGLSATATTYRGTVEVTSGGANLVIAGTDATKAGLVAGTTAITVNTLSVGTAAGANLVISAVDNALNTVNGSRATLGAIQNRFESVVTSLQTSSESLSAARSRIQDTDFAAETAQLTKSQILQQAGMAMMAQANSLPQNVLSLLQ